MQKLRQAGYFGCVCVYLGYKTSLISVLGVINLYQLNPEYFVKSWRMKGNNKPSVVYRYMKQDYINDFFQTGRLKLSSFQTNREIENDIRQDESEGKQVFTIVSRNKTNHISLVAQDYDARRMFCCSNSNDLDTLLPHFKVNGCFEISNSLGFAYEVAKKLDAFIMGHEGPVNYNAKDARIIYLESFPMLPDLPSNPSNQDLFPYIDFLGTKYHDMFYHKHQQYNVEKEFRFVWQCKMKHDFFIDCPEARKFCKRIT